MWEMHDGWGWWMMFGWVWMLVVVGLVAWGVSALVSGRDGREGGRAERREGAVDILERRYAQGEIDHEEFEERRRRLLSGGG